MKLRFGPLTIGTCFGAAIGLAIATYGLYAIRQGSIQRSHESVLLIAFVVAGPGGGLGVFAEHVIQHQV